MERNCNLKIKISKEIAEKYQLAPNTVFNAYFDGEHIVLKHLDKSKKKTKFLLKTRRLCDIIFTED